MKSDTTILVLVAALREALLAQTLQSFFTNATYPGNGTKHFEVKFFLKNYFYLPSQLDRVHFGIVQQNAKVDKDIVEDYCEKIGKPVKVIK
jgi:hypothetical protein